MEFYEGGELGGFGMDGIFGNLEGIKEDAIEFGILAAGGLAGAAAAKYIIRKLGEQTAAGKTLSFLGTSTGYVLPLVPAALGIVGGGWLLKSGKVSNPMAQNAVKGVALGMVSYGVAALVFGKLVTDAETQRLNPYSLSGCIGCGGGYGGYAGYSPAGYLGSAGPSTFEENASGVGAGPVSIEETSGVGQSPTSVEEDDGVAGLAATFG